MTFHMALTVIMLEISCFFFKSGVHVYKAPKYLGHWLKKKFSLWSNSQEDTGEGNRRPNLTNKQQGS